MSRKQTSILAIPCLLSIMSFLLSSCMAGQLFGPTFTPTSSPTLTPSPTITPSVTPTPTSTPVPPTLTPLPTATPYPDFINMNDDGKGRRWCEPAIVAAGRIVIWRAIGRWSTQQQAITALGDSWPPITANGQPLVVTNLERSEPEWHTNGDDDPSPGWGFSATVEIQLTAGVYELFSSWLGDVKSCTITVK